MHRTTITLSVLCVLATIATGQAATREQSMQAWGAHVGTWEMIGPNGVSGTVSITKAESGACYIHQADTATYVAGWDDEEGKLKVVGFRADGGSSESYWELVGDGPKFEGKSADGTAMVVEFTSKDRWVLEAGDMRYVFERKE